MPGMNKITEAKINGPSIMLWDKLSAVSNAKLDESSNTLGVSFVMKATEPDASIYRTFCLLFGLLIVVFLQMTLMGTFYLASSLQPCYAHSGCNQGKYCCKCNDYCRDCADANFRPDYIPPEDFIEYVAHCNKTDTLPTRCDHIVKHQDLTEAITEHALFLKVAAPVSEV